MRQSLGVVGECGGDAIKPPVWWKRLRGALLPEPEAHEHMQSHRNEALQPVRHGWNLDSQELLGNRCGEGIGGFESTCAPPGEHGPRHTEAVARGTRAG